MIESVTTGLLMSFCLFLLLFFNQVKEMNSLEQTNTIFLNIFRV